MKVVTLALIILVMPFIVSGFEKKWWLNEADAKSSSQKFQGCKACRGAGYRSKLVKIGDADYNLSSYFPKLAKGNSKKIFIQCDSCTTAIDEALRKQAEDKKKETLAKHEEEQKKEHQRLSAVCESLIGLVDEVDVGKIDHGTWSEWCLKPKNRDKDKDYTWSAEAAKLMPARCPIVFQVLNPKSFLIKSQVNGTLVIIETTDDYEVSDGEPFLKWGTYQYSGTKSYATVVGAKKTVPLIKQTK